MKQPRGRMPPPAAGTALGEVAAPRAVEPRGWRRRAGLLGRRAGRFMQRRLSSTASRLMADDPSGRAPGGELVPGGELRASHDDRDRVVEVLTGAAGDGAVR